MKDLRNVHSVISAEDGEKGYTKDCFGKNAQHNVIKVPVGTIVRDLNGRILADLDKDGMMFIAARGGAGGHGNAFFKSDTQQSPEISEYGAIGEDLRYVLEIRSMAHVGLVSVICIILIIIMILFPSKKLIFKNIFQILVYYKMCYKYIIKYFYYARYKTTNACYHFCFIFCYELVYRLVYQMLVKVHF